MLRNPWALDSNGDNGHRKKENWDWKKSAKVQRDTAKTCQYLTKFSKKCIFSPIMGNLEFCVFLYGKVVVPLQWISRETDEICGLWHGGEN